MRRLTPLILLALIAPAGTAAAKGEPPELLATITRPPAGGFDDLRAFIDAIKPGAGMFINDATLDQGLASEVGATSLDALDHRVASYVLAIDTGAAKGFVIVGKVADDKALAAAAGRATVLAKGGWAAIGDKALVGKVGAFALASLPRASGTALHATLYVPALLARYGEDVAAIKRQLGLSAADMGGAAAGLVESYVDGLLGAARDSERLEIGLTGSKDVGDLDLALAPRAGTKLAAFVALQRPSGYALLGNLPAGGAPIVMVGHLLSGPYRQGLMELMTKMYGGTLPAAGAAAMGDLMKACSGEFAVRMAITPGKPMEFAELFGVDDAPGFDRAMAALVKVLAGGVSLEGFGMKTTIAPLAVPPPHDGVPLAGLGIAYDFSAMPPAQQGQLQAMFPGGKLATYRATFDKLAAFATSAATVGAAIDTARGHGAPASPSATATSLLEASRARKESVAMVFDLGALLPTGKGDRSLLMSLGFAAGALHVHLALPTATLRALAP
jgi:hypothetical protein